MEKKEMTNTWKNSNIHVFWGELAPCDHMIQVYESDNGFLDMLEAFAGSGLSVGDSVVVIATPSHLDELNQRLVNNNFNPAGLADEGQYFPLDAEETLARFMINNWPDEELFIAYIEELLRKARQNNRRVRAFGEMVAVLWSQGLNGATVRLENLWNQLHQRDNFSLYCAYPKTGFTQSPNDSFDKICAAHTRIIDNSSAQPATEIYYRDVR